MIASTGEALNQWKRGAVSESLFWKKCFLDPQELLGSSN